MNILLITGGSSSERTVSLRSAKGVREALLQLGHTVTVFDFRLGYAKLKLSLKKVNLVFPVMHGKEGEDGTLYRFLQNNHIPYVGSDPAGARTAFDKVLFKKFCETKSIRTAPWRIVKNTKAIARFGLPCVLKAAHGGSSHEVALIQSAKELMSKKVQNILGLPCRSYVETLLHGEEITVGVLRGKPLPVVEITPPEDGWFDYKNKYSGKSRELPFAPSVPLKLQHEAQRIARRIHNDLQLGAYSRSDFIVQNGKLYILETNTPGGVGLTAESLLPKAALAAGMNFTQLITCIIQS